MGFACLLLFIEVIRGQVINILSCSKYRLLITRRRIRAISQIMYISRQSNVAHAGRGKNQDEKNNHLRRAHEAASVHDERFDWPNNKTEDEEKGRRR